MSDAAPKTPDTTDAAGSEQSAPTPAPAEHGDRKQRHSFSLQRQFVTETSLLDQFFFLASGVVSVWLGVVLLLQGARFGWGWYAVVLLAGWLVTAYLTLPRLHRILSNIYVPNYFIGRTRTSDGLLGDPVNVAFAGREDQIHSAMLAAGWTRADDITAQSAWRIVTATITRRSYDEAPVSPLFLFGRRQDFAYQQEVEGNPGKRHHVRFWQCPDGWLLPGGRRVGWLAAGTYDKAIGFSLFTLQITHKIDENTDIERDHIVATVLDGNPDARVTVIEDFSTGYHSRNGGGDRIVTDGDLPILDVRSLPFTAPEEEAVEVAALSLDATRLSTELEETGRDIWQRRPLSLVAGCILAVLAALLGMGRFLWQITHLGPDGTQTLDEIVRSDLGFVPQEVLSQLWPMIIGLSCAVVVVQFIAALLAMRGGRVARKFLMTIVLISCVGLLGMNASTTVGRWGLLIDLTILLLLAASLLALSSSASREFVRAHRWRQRFARK